MALLRRKEREQQSKDSASESEEEIDYEETSIMYCYMS